MADHLIDEVDEALRREKLETFWKRFGQYVMVGSALVLVATVAAVLWQNHEAAKRREWTSAMLEAAEDFNAKKYREAGKALEKAAHHGGGELAVMTALWRAELALRQDKPEKARAFLTSLDDDGIYGQYGKLMLQATEKTSDKHEDATGDFAYTAREIMASRLAESGERSKAAEAFKRLAEDALTPSSMHERAQLIAHRLAMPAPSSATTQPAAHP